MENFLMRSLLFVPSHNDKLLKSALQTQADVLLLDIEDSVQPKENKQVARDKILQLVKNGQLDDRVVFPRVNDRESGHLLQDVYQLTIEGINGFMYPKAKTAEDIYFFDKLLETIEFEKGMPIGAFKIIALIETAAAVMNVQEICRASKRLVAVAYGSEDFISDLEGIHDDEHLSLFTPRAMIAMGARAQGIIPIDTVHVNVHDLEDLEQNISLSKKLGFEGMLALNPKELDLIHQYYSPSEEEYLNALDLFELSKKATMEGKGVAIMNGKFIGPPMILKAKKIIDKKMLIQRTQENCNNKK
ncbi:HpcH/HpaI aldolase/citrate lyase family protein [Roseivirga sp.]|uniref:HpcH/HpaI aldolase/citrate lyase family protein n=1 Tax=Roseivirga sp. TaxID=1964215 RepID=UPI003B51595F